MKAHTGHGELCGLQCFENDSTAFVTVSLGGFVFRERFNRIRYRFTWGIRLSGTIQPHSLPFHLGDSSFGNDSELFKHNLEKCLNFCLRSR
ncbi:hypothetical protein [Bacillus niameyensis]|uniref:hypothetical protein n=1 Tax=Bacillus niameyensis TaxID=1522308 RepID=UPI001E422D4C|nr:hypothetical protein [Bacillus niameyensis]